VVSLPPKTSLDNVPSTSSFHNQSRLWRSPFVKMHCLHAIFDLNGVLVVKQALGFHMRMQTNSTFALKLGLKDFLISCLS
jgi:hypothetical protein